jgi:hypothetical protein
MIEPASDVRDVDEFLACRRGQQRPTRARPARLGPSADHELLLSTSFSFAQSGVRSETAWTTSASDQASQPRQSPTVELAPVAGHLLSMAGAASRCRRWCSSAARRAPASCREGRGRRHHVERDERGGRVVGLSLTYGCGLQVLEADGAAARERDDLAVDTARCLTFSAKRASASRRRELGGLVVAEARKRRTSGTGRPG